MKTGDLKCKKLLGILCHFLIPAYWLFAFFSCLSLYQKNDLDSRILFWLLIDSVLPVSIIFILAFITSLRSYVYIYKGGIRLLCSNSVRKLIVKMKLKNVNDRT